MRQIAYPATLGSCVLGAGVTTPVRAAEWSITPTYTSSVDYDTNRTLVDGGRGSTATSLAGDLLLKVALEDIELILEPHYTWRRFSRSQFGNGDDRDVTGALNWKTERWTLNLNAAYYDQSTLVTELLETGVIDGSTHRRSAQEGATWTWNQTERQALVLQFNYTDVSYYGLNAGFLPGYRDPSGSVTEQLSWNERLTFTLGVFGTQLESDSKFNSNRELGLQAGLTYMFAENTRLDASLGESRRTLLGENSNGTDSSVSLTHDTERTKYTLSYRRSLVPYGFGFLSEQTAYSAIAIRQLTESLSANLGYVRIQNNQTTVLLHLDRPGYNTVAGGLTWRATESLTLGMQFDNTRTQTLENTQTQIDLQRSVSRWRTTLTLTWRPYPTSVSW